MLNFSRCVSSHWECSEEVCGKRCSAVGDPHYTTFDGKQFDFMGQCSYTMIQHPDVEIETENIPCNGAISQVPFQIFLLIVFTKCFGRK
jgi:von Willebrand factor